MIIRNRLISFIYRLLSFVAMVVILAFYLTSSGRAVWQSLCYFGPEVALAFTVLLGLETIFNGIDLRRGVRGVPAGVYPPVSLAIFGYVFLALISYCAITIPVNRGFSDVELFVHIAMFVLAFLDWLLFMEKGTVHWYVAFNFAAYPLLYGAFILCRPFVWPDNPIDYSGNFYPYQFYDPTDPLFYVYASAAMGIVIGFGALLILFNNLIGGKYRKRKRFN